MPKQGILRTLAVAAAVLLMTACATSHTLVGTPRAPIDPAEVRIYYGPPPGGHEEIALLQTASGPFTYGEQNKTNNVLAKLRAEAAKLGANGILFRGTSDGYGGGGVSVGGGVGVGRVSGGGGSFRTSGVGVGVDISPRQKHASGIAIYVRNPPPPLPPPPR